MGAQDISQTVFTYRSNNISNALGVPSTTLNYQIRAHLNAGKKEGANERSTTAPVDP